ncbi:hypothetical protein INT45_014027, partial [Circinella minor]
YLSSLSCSPFNERDLNKTDEIMKKLKHVTVEILQIC